MKYRYFPVNMGELAAEIEYVRLKEESHIDLGDGITLSTKIINHPITALGYRFSFRGSVFCTAYDSEPFRNLFITDPDDPAYDELMAQEGDRVANEQNQGLEDFFGGSDLLVYDSQYTNEEYQKGKKGWGHTTIEYAISAADRSGVKRLALFHHDPERTDLELDLMTKKYCNSKGSHVPEIFFAREGTVLEI